MRSAPSLKIQRHIGLHLKHYSQSILKDDESGFTGFYLSKLGPQVPSDPHYKLHLNFNDESFIHHRSQIARCIDELAYLGVVVYFKFFNFSKSTLIYDPVFCDAELQIRILEYLNVYNRLDAKDLSRNLQTKDAHTWAKDAFKLYDENLLNIKRSYEELLEAKLSTQRFLNQAQFTLYFATSLNINKISHFCRALNFKLQRLPVKAGTVCNTDVLLTPLLSLRQITVDNVYITATPEDIEPKVHARLLRRLKKEALESSLCLILRHDLQHLPVVEAKAAPEKQSMPGLFSSPNPTPSVSPLAWYQEGENSFIKNDIKAALSSYEKAYEAIQQLKIRSAEDGTLRDIVDKKIFILARALIAKQGTPKPATT